MDYKKIYNRDYFTGKTSFFYKLGYGDIMLPYFAAMYRHIRRYAKGIKKARVLDAGCAFGFMLKQFPDNFERYGIDVSSYAILQAKKRLPNAVLKVANLEDKLPFRKDFFDIVVMNDVLEHIEKPEKALKNMHAVLKPGGLLFITTPNLNWFRRNVSAFADRMEHHVSMFSRKHLFAFLTKHGFEIIESWTFIDLLLFFKIKSDFGLETAVVCRKTKDKVN